MSKTEERLVELESENMQLLNKLNWMMFENKDLMFKLKKAESALNQMKCCYRCFSANTALEAEPCASCDNYSNWH